MKQTLKLILSLLLGAVIGFGAVMFCIVMFTGTSADEFLGKLGNVQLATMLLSCLLSLVCLSVAVFVQIILHEAGHLIFGLATGYRFVSFRVGSLTLIKENGRFRFKLFSISGTGGQCLLAPPDVPYKRLPYFWYNAGGVLMNLIISVLTLILWIKFPDAPIAIKLFLLFSFLSGIFLALMNGIPMKMAGITNDGHNIMMMRKDLISRKYLAIQLAVNAEIQKGVRIKDMPEEWFPDIEITDYHNILQLAVKLLYAGRLIDRMDYEAARPHFSELMKHRHEIIGLYEKEITCELIFLELMGECRKEEIEQLYTDKLQKYIERYKTMMSSKQRLRCALALHWDNDPEKAKDIYLKVLAKKDKFLMQGEVASDLEIMEKMLMDAGVAIS